MIKYILIFIGTLTICNSIQSQENLNLSIDLHEFGKIKWDSLINQNIDTIIELYSGNHSGDYLVTENSDTCICKGNNIFRFYIWEIGTKKYIQKISCCKIHTAKLLTSNNLFVFLNKNLKTLENEEYKTNSVVASSFIQLKYKFGKNEGIKYFDNYMINKKYEPENWKINKKLKSHKILKKMLKKAEKVWK